MKGQHLWKMMMEFSRLLNEWLKSLSRDEKINAEPVLADMMVWFTNLSIPLREDIHRTTHRLLRTFTLPNEKQFNTYLDNWLSILSDKQKEQAKPIVDALRAWIVQQRQKRAKRLETIMKFFDAPDAKTWVLSEMKEDIPQVSLFSFVQPIWSDAIDIYINDLSWIEKLISEAKTNSQSPSTNPGKSLAHMLSLGCDPKDIARIARYASYMAFFDALVSLSGINARNLPDEIDMQIPYLVVTELDRDQELTGRILSGMHELLLSLDPSGRDGAPERGEEL